MEKFKKFIAEFIGTFVLVFFACGTAVVVECDKKSFNAAYILTALAFGLVIVAMAYSIGNTSGCHINPAVSLAMLISGRMSFVDFILYVIAQFGGATAGAALLKYFFGANDDCTFGINTLYQGDLIQSVIIEAILTFVFVIAILGVTAKEENNAVCGVVIGLTLTLVHIFGIHFTGTSVNPARSFGPALVAGTLSDVWVFIAGPLAGAILAALIYKLIEIKEDK